MSKRLSILTIVVVLLFGALIATGLLIRFGSVRYHSSPDEVRAFARVDFEETFAPGANPLPELSSSAPLPEFSLDDSADGEIAIEYVPTQRFDSACYGDLIEADPSTQSLELPNGQIVRLLAVAFSPRPERLFDEDDPERWNRQLEIGWRDPVSLAPIEDASSLGLADELYAANEPQLILAFHCSETEEHPVRWHGLKLHDRRTRASISRSASWQSAGPGITIYQLNLSIHHSTPVQVLLPISYGEPEILPVDPTRPDAKLTFGGEAVALTFLRSRNGDQNGSSSTGGGESLRRLFRFQPVTSERAYDRSFSLVAVWPRPQGMTLEYQVGEEGSWRSFHPNDVLNSVTYPRDLEKLGSVRWRRLPELARAVFRLDSIPGLPELDNLFSAEIGPLRFDYDGDFRDAIRDTVLFEWQLGAGGIPREEFPIEFDDPTITPAQLLEDYGQRIGEDIQVDSTNHAIGPPGPGVLERIGRWFKKTWQRIFP